MSRTWHTKNCFSAFKPSTTRFHFLRRSDGFPLPMLGFFAAALILRSNSVGAVSTSLDRPMRQSLCDEVVATFQTLRDFQSVLASSLSHESSGITGRCFESTFAKAFYLLIDCTCHSLEPGSRFQ